MAGRRDQPDRPGEAAGGARWRPLDIRRREDVVTLAEAAAETAVRAVVPGAVIARTSLIIGDGGSPQERFVHDVVSGRRQGVLSTDDIRCPMPQR